MSGWLTINKQNEQKGSDEKHVFVLMLLMVMVLLVLLVMLAIVMLVMVVVDIRCLLVVNMCV